MLEETFLTCVGYFPEIVQHLADDGNIVPHELELETIYQRQHQQDQEEG